MAKTYKNIYPGIYDFQNLHSAYLRARKGKRYRSEVLQFSSSLEENLIQLQNELIWKTYKTGKYREFLVLEPKRRNVSALPFRDRVLQHALVAMIEPIWERRFVYDSYACRPGKGTLAGANRAQNFLRKIKQKYGEVYALKADISKYFASIDHKTLKLLIRKRVACASTLSLLDNVINSTPGAKGIPLGNLTSQLFANIYLHELDEFVKYRLCEKYYVRYMDDFIIIHQNKSYLHDVRRKIECFIWQHLQLCTNAKTQVFPVGIIHSRALDFLGYRIWPCYRKLRKDVTKRINKRLRHLQVLYAKGIIDAEQLNASITAWLGHVKHTSSYGLRTKLLGSVVPTGNDQASKVGP